MATSPAIHNKVIAAVATVVKPMHAFVGGPEPLLSVDYYTNSLGLQCAPSHSVTGSSANGASSGEGEFPLIGLEQGFTLVFPDHLGPQSEYVVGFQNAHHPRRYPGGARLSPAWPQRADASRMEGYSGGSVPTMWGATIAGRYAPELRIVAVASGGTVANLKHVVKSFDSLVGNTAAFSLGLSAMFGVNRAFPSLLTPILNAKGVAAGNALKNGCVGGTGDGSPKPTGHFADYTTIPDPLDNPTVDKILLENGLPVRGYAAPPMPLYVYHSQVDEIVPVTDTDALVRGYCAQGTHVAYYVGPAGEHISFDFTMAPSVFAYFSSRFAGLPEVVPPGTTTCN